MGIRRTSPHRWVSKILTCKLAGLWLSITEEHTVSRGANSRRQATSEIPRHPYPTTAEQ